ncbi:MAG: flagellar assembly protein FliW [Deltaproteobacteria bacterium]|nr:flagellar assembly protein FliW [Deltaproteobacteria bacterium]
MIIETRAFGPVEIDEERMMKFVGPMLGFEGADRYALIDLNPESPFKVLQLADRGEICFLVTDPSFFFPNYKVTLSTEEVADLGLTDPSKAAVLLVVTIREGGKRLTANLKAPVVVNAEKLLAKQVVLKTDAYKVDEPIPLDLGKTP